ncbi:glutathione S-transferase family protein [Horticoccus luteus]|uniref:Glutathione S-transferase family protein n=1 Tax=Horticoccus luteus TaxID=2862869 RepID=A0A8F9XMK8_9BACT|nr:glutathione S-transferase family protein [Horticoccus luteus]QYM80139.1 glutathione S-transferase family protein [Horticoccus luteus]
MTTAQFPDEQGTGGEFVRQGDAFRAWVSNDGATEFPAVAGRYHLYVSLACPWAHRTLIVRKILGLAEAVSVGVVDPVRDERGWAFREGPGHGADAVNGFKFLSEAYFASEPDYRGRYTVPVLWDKETRRIVNNSEDDICRMFNDAFRGLARTPGELFPAKLEAEHGELAKFIYENVNNGVYRAGFATTQGAYEKAARDVFAALDKLETRLATRRYLLGRRIVEADWRLFCTLVRFDAVYHGHFKCNVRRIVDYPNLYGYLRDLYQQSGVRETVNFDHIKRHYYMTHEEINPTRIVPIGPELDLDSAHGRELVANVA